MHVYFVAMQGLIRVLGLGVCKWQHDHFAVMEGLLLKHRNHFEALGGLLGLGAAAAAGDAQMAARQF